MPELSIIIPAYNESRRLSSAVGAVFAVGRALDLLDNLEMIVVDDGSTDHTAALARELLDQFPSSSVIELGRNFGKGRAVTAGVQASSGAKIVFVDADNATDLASLTPMLAGLDRFDVAIGSRAAIGSTVRQASLSRTYGGRAFNACVRAITGLRWRDTQCGFKGFTRRGADEIFSRTTTDGFGFDVEVLLLADRLGLKVCEIPVDWTAVSGGSFSPAKQLIPTLREVYETRRRLKNSAW